MTVFLVEQNAYHALRLAHRGYVMVNGQIVLSGRGKELLANPEVRAAYLEGGQGGQGDERYSTASRPASSWSPSSACSAAAPCTWARRWRRRGGPCWQILAYPLLLGRPYHGLAACALFARRACSRRVRLPGERGHVRWCSISRSGLVRLPADPSPQDGPAISLALRAGRALSAGANVERERSNGMLEPLAICMGPLVSVRPSRREAQRQSRRPGNGLSGSVAVPSNQLRGGQNECVNA